MLTTLYGDLPTYYETRALIGWPLEAANQKACYEIRGPITAHVSSMADHTEMELRKWR
jgi:hypothetical protein